MIQTTMDFEKNQEIEDLLDVIREDITKADMSPTQASSTWNSGLASFNNRNGHAMNMPVAKGYTDTSEAAGKKIEIRVGSLRSKVYNALYDQGPMSTTQIANYLGKKNSGIQPRTSELKQGGFIEDSKLRWTNESDNQEIVWRVCA